MISDSVLLRLGAADDHVSLSKAECKALLERVNFLEKFCAGLLTSIKRKRKQIDVLVPFRTQAL